MENATNNKFSAASPVFINKNDQLFKNAKNIKPIKGFEDIVVHSDADKFYLYGNDGAEYQFTPKEFAEIVKTSKNYNGGGSDGKWKIFKPGGCIDEQ